jgi:predicted P-loop ATPase
MPFKPAHKQPGMAAMIGIGHLLTDTHGCTVQLLPIPAPGLVPDGWDAADAIQTDGWGFAEVMEFFGRAGPLPAMDGQAPAAVADPAKKIDPPVGTTASEVAGDDAAVADSKLPFWLKPYWDADKSRWNVSRKTVIAALRHDDLLANAIGFNQLSNNMELRLDWPFAQGKAGRIKGTTDLLLGDWLSKQYKLPAITRQAITEAMETVAHENAWHPIHDYLRSLQWDGTERLDKWLIWTLGETPESLGPVMTEYFSRVGRYWILGMVNRVMYPGCKFDYCPVLEGPGGLGKSTMVEVLASTDWYSDTQFEIGKGKESSEQVGGVWCIELGEMSAMGKAEVTAVKAFITSKVDRYRPAYARTIEEFPRQCVLVGTTNENTYLRDRTGNRRFWPIPVKQPIKTSWLARWRDQLFAEAYALYLAGTPYTPGREEEERLFAPMQEDRLIETAVTSELLTVLTRDPGKGTYGDIVNNLTEFVTIDMLCHALGADAGKAPAGMQTEIRTWMNSQGWENKKVQINGVRRPGWVRPKNWPPVEPEEATATPAPDAASAGASPVMDVFTDHAPF